jgi:hypothetical protein
MSIPVSPDAVNAIYVEWYVDILHTRAEKAGIPGKLTVLALPTDKTAIDPSAFGNGEAGAAEPCSEILHFDIGQRKGMAEAITRLAPTYDVKVPLAVMRPDLGRWSPGKLEDVVALLGYLFDADEYGADGQPKEPIKLPASLKPTLTWRSSPHGKHHVILLEEPIKDIGLAKQIGVALADMTGDEGVARINIVRRLPGTINHKRETPAVVTLEVEPGATIDLASLQSVVAAHIKPLPETKVAEPAKPATEAAIADLKRAVELVIKDDPKWFEDRNNRLFTNWGIKRGGYGPAGYEIAKMFCSLTRSKKRIARLDRYWFDAGADEGERTLGEFWKKAHALGFKQSKEALDEWRAQEAPSPSETEQAIARLNSQYAVVLYKKDAVILKEGTKDGIDFLKIPSFKIWFQNDLVKVGTKKDGTPEYMRVAELWLNSPRRRQYEGVEFSPTGKVPHGYYNLWTGWGVAAAPISYEEAFAHCGLFLDHIYQNVCGGNVDHYNYVLAWFADIIQDPANLKGVALVLRGLKGTGKSKVFEVMRNVIGRHSITVAHGSQLTGRFNAHLVAKLLVVAEESYWSGDKASEGALKTLITARVATIEMKGKDCVEVDAFARVGMVTNNEWAVPASNDERRYAVFDVGEARRGDHAYFAAIDAEMANGGYEALFTLLQRFPLHTVDLRKVPETAGLRKQRERSLEPHDQYVLDLLNGLPVSGKSLGETPILFGKEETHKAYIDRSRERGKIHLLDYTHFCKKFIAATGAKATRPRDVIGGRKQMFTLSSREDVRKHFSAYAKVDIEEGEI